MDATFLEPVIDVAVRLLPVVGKVGGVAVVGVVGSLALSRTVRWGLTRAGLEAGIERLGGAAALERLRLQGRLPVACGKLVFWLGMFITAYIAAEVAGWSGVSGVIGKVVGFLPQALAAAGIVLAGLWGASMAERAVTGALSRRDGVEAPELVGKAVSALVVMLTTAMAAGQLGFEVTLINGLLTITVGAFALGVGLTAALGSQQMVGNMVLRQYVERTLEEGDEVEIGGVMGTVAGFGPSVLVLRTPHGRRFIPYKIVLDGAIRRVSGRSARQEELRAP